MMKVGKVGWLVVLVLTVMVFNLSTCSAWFGSKHKSLRNSILPDDVSSSTSRFMNPAGSSIVFPVHGNVYPVGFYNITLNIGQPPRPFFLDVDTGSDLTWLQCDAPCSHCSETPHPLYRPSNDFVPCKDPLCASLQPTDDYNCEDPNQCDYEIEYADHYSSLGVLLNDVYLLNFTNGVQLKVRMALGCGYDQDFSPSSYHPLDGILGLGRGKASLISQLNSQGLVQNVIGHCLSSKGGGYIFFGNVYDSSRLSWTPISSIDSKHYSAGPAELVFGGKKTGVGSLTAVFDTGSSYTYFNSQAYQALLSWLKKELTGKSIKAAPDDQTLPLCWHGRRPFKSIREVRKYFKPLALSFTNGGRVKAQFEIPPEAYLIISNMGNVCLGILNGSEVGLGDVNLIGDISMQDKLMVFDNDKQLIGWGSADCNYVPRSRHVSI
ncbi:aspartic proteinase Asp1-like [Gastrolobium bilobum]|uniref:aspartic proteinase Asp1-like n=1 Tax=Gastrolobium bilobum TaxID=150636 RepID=UPI002AB04698|nr:aspartic proteinase Asp1-like [Gastrolobium bilobum]